MPPAVRPGAGSLPEVQMTKSELIAHLAAKQPQLDYRDVELAVKELLDQLSTALAATRSAGRSRWRRP